MPANRQRPPAPPGLRAEWERLLTIMPDSVRAAVTPELWNMAWLHALDLPVQRMAVSDLAWLFDVPLWAVDGEPFRVTPNEIRANPERFEAQYRRTMEADLSWPIHVMWFQGRSIVLDGVHRLLKADMQGEATIGVRYLSREDYASILYGPDDA
jgi:hypothetical protein